MRPESISDDVVVSVKGKVAGDFVEAIIGAFAHCCGEGAAWAIVVALVGISRPSDFEGQEEAQSGHDADRTNQQLAERLGYKYHKSCLLGAALTHTPNPTVR